MIDDDAVTARAMKATPFSLRQTGNYESDR